MVALFVLFALLFFTRLPIALVLAIACLVYAVWMVGRAVWDLLRLESQHPELITDKETQ